MLTAEIYSICVSIYLR